MKIDVVKRRAKVILSKDRITKHDIRWFNAQVERWKDIQESWEINLDADIPLTYRQAKSKGRKLTEDDCYAIRSAYMRGDVTQDALGKLYGVSRRTIFLALYPEKRKYQNVW